MDDEVSAITPAGNGHQEESCSNDEEEVGEGESNGGDERIGSDDGGDRGDVQDMEIDEPSNQSEASKSMLSSSVSNNTAGNDDVESPDTKRLRKEEQDREVLH